MIQGFRLNHINIIKFSLYYFSKDKTKTNKKHVIIYIVIKFTFITYLIVFEFNKNKSLNYRYIFIHILIVCLMMGYIISIYWKIFFRNITLLIKIIFFWGYCSRYVWLIRNWRTIISLKLGWSSIYPSLSHYSSSWSSISYCSPYYNCILSNIPFPFYWMIDLICCRVLMKWHLRLRMTCFITIQIFQ